MEIDLEVLRNYKGIIGCDEVGRGPIAGPVNGCAVYISKKSESIIQKLFDLKITDSKKLTDKKREKILAELGIDAKNLKPGMLYQNQFLGETFSFCIGEHSHSDIDKMNILQASLSAMKSASEVFDCNKVKILVDGNKVFDSKHDIECLIKGDSKSIAIGLASIIAKVFRDEKMKVLDQKFPGYNLGKHAGYPTKEHKLAVQKLGPSPIHRKSFKGVKEYI